MATAGSIPAGPAAAVDAGLSDVSPRTANAGGQVRWLLRAESLVTLVAGLVGYGSLGGSWLAFVPLVLLPDVAMVGYLRNARLGR
jgi:hypothetical protein